MKHLVSERQCVEVYPSPSQPAKPFLASNSLVNAASLADRQPIAPGEIVTIFGANLGPSGGLEFELNADGRVDTILGGVRVFFNGVPAPLLFVRSDQINAVVPYAIASLSLATLWVEYGGLRSDNLFTLVKDTAPGIFMANGKRGQAAALNQDSMANCPTNPAPRGSVVTLFATGEGHTDPPGIDGSIASSVHPKPRAAVFVSVGRQSAEVLYAGAAPGLVAGMLQVNVRIPENAPRGPAVPITLTIGDVPSQPSTTIAVC